MPEYLAPGVYVEEKSFRPKTIEGVSTSTAGFVGPTRTGPTSGEPPLLTSFADFQRIYGGLENLEFDSEPPRTNYLAYGVRSFFEEGGQRCYVARVFSEISGADTGRAEGTGDGSLVVRGRYPGALGNLRVTFRAVESRAVAPNDEDRLTGMNLGESVFAVVEVPDNGGTTTVRDFFDYILDGDGDPALVNDAETVKVSALSGTDAVHPLRVRVFTQRRIQRPGGGVEFGPEVELGTYNLRPGTPNALVDALSADNPSGNAMMTPIAIAPLTDGSGPLTLGAAYASDLFNIAGTEASPGDVEDAVITLSDGNDGQEPTSYETDVTGALPPDDPEGFDALEDLDDISIVAAPGYSALSSPNAESVQGELIGHCKDMKYRIAVLDTPEDQTVGQARDWRGQIDSTYAAIYYPWITILDPLSRSPLNLPPSGFVAGIYARNDVQNGVQKAPANEVVRSAIGFEKRINKAQQEVLNPEAVNCFRFFEGRGNRLWGARMATSDGEYKYVNIRRYLAYLERSVDEGTQVFVFESNGSDLWRNVTGTITSFLTNEWRSNRLMGTTPEQAFFVRCDRSTMTQNDIDNGRLICEIGVALLRPAEFVIFRIGQKLLDA